MARKSAAALATPTIFSTKRPPPPDGLPAGAGLKKALQVGPRPWDCDPEIEQYFS